MYYLFLLIKEYSFSLYCMSGCMLSYSVVSNPLRPHGLQPARLLCPWDFPGKNIGVSCCFSLHEIVPTQGSNLGLLHCKQILYNLSRQGNEPPFILRSAFIIKTYSSPYIMNLRVFVESGFWPLNAWRFVRCACYHPSVIKVCFLWRLFLKTVRWVILPLHLKYDAECQQRFYL